MEKDILLIGSEHLSMYKDACKDLPVSIRTTDDQKNALATIQEKIPNLIIVDNEAISGSSVEVCQTLKNFPVTQRLPLLFVTAKKISKELLEILFLPVNDYVFLPLDLEDFQLRLKAQLDLQELKQEKKLSSVEEKIEELEKLIQIFPDYNAARQELAELYENSGKVEEALNARLGLAKEYYQANNIGLAMDAITQMKTMLAKHNVQFTNYTKFVEALERCEQFLQVDNKNTPSE